MGSTVWRRVRSVAYYLFLAVAGLIVVTVGVNLFDATESADYQALQAVALRPDKLPASNNSYFGVLGLYAPHGADAAQAGHALFDAARKLDTALVQKAASASLAEVQELIGQAQKSPVGFRSFADDKPVLELCGLNDCVSKVAANVVQVQAFLDANQEPLRRFEDLVNHPFEAPLRPDFNLWGTMLPGSELMHINDTRLLHLAVLVAQGKDDEALAGWSASLGFAQRMQEGSRELIQSVMGMAMQHKHYGWLMDYLQAHPERARARLPALRKLAAMPADGSAALSRVIASECFWVARSFLLPGMPLSEDAKLSNPALNLLVKRQASANEAVHQCDPAMAVLAQKPGSVEYSGALLDASPVATKRSVLRGFWPYNLVGKVLVSVASADWRPYIYRRDAVLADSLVVGLALDVMELPVADKAAIDTLLANPSLRHPFFRDAPAWQADGRLIGFPAAPPEMTGGGLFKSNLQFEPAKLQVANSAKI